MRRAWSSALFLTLQKLYLGGAVKNTCRTSEVDAKKRPVWWGGCEFLVSDSYLSQRNGARYRVSAPEPIAGADPGDPIIGDPSSDDWYKRWWMLLERQEFNHPGAQQNAKYFAEEACKDYVSAISRDYVVVNNPKDMPVPACSLMLATDFAVYVAIDFPDVWSPAYINYQEDALPKAFGRAFANTPYRGAVIFRSPWDRRRRDRPRLLVVRPA